MDILGYSISTGYPPYSGTGRIVVNCLNPHSYYIASKDKLFSTALQDSDFLMPDGVGIVMAARVLHGSRIDRITGSDLHLHFLRIAEDLKLRVFYLGAGMETIARIKQRLGTEHPGIVMSGYDPPYKAEFDEYDNSQMVEAVNKFSPDILFVGMTAPKQEKWSGRHSGQLKVKVICNIGAVFDFYAGTVKRPGKFWTSNGLEWLGRLIREPGRLWKRTFISHPVFVLDVLAARFFNFKRLSRV